MEGDIGEICAHLFTQLRFDLFGCSGTGDGGGNAVGFGFRSGDLVLQEVLLEFGLHQGVQIGIALSGNQTGSVNGRRII